MKGGENLPAGWVRQSLQVPAELAQAFRQQAQERRHSGVKALGTAAIALIMGIPESAREELVRQVVLAELSEPPTFTPEEAWAILCQVIKREDEPKKKRA